MHKRLAAAFVLALAACSESPQTQAPRQTIGAPQQPARSQICDAYDRQAQKVTVEVNGTVVKVLGIRRGPSGVHEGFLVALTPAMGCALTIRVEHNVDLGGRIPLSRGEPVELRGEYIYDPRGGILHWTHHDPRGRHIGGYVRANGELYQ